MGWPVFFMAGGICYLPVFYPAGQHYLDTTCPAAQDKPRGILLGGTKDPLHFIGPRFP
jgi:hypothetical protein